MPRLCLCCILSDDAVRRHPPSIHMLETLLLPRTHHTQQICRHVTGLTGGRNPLPKKVFHHVDEHTDRKSGRKQVVWLWPWALALLRNDPGGRGGASGRWLLGVLPRVVRNFVRAEPFRVLLGAEGSCRAGVASRCSAEDQICACAVNIGEDPCLRVKPREHGNGDVSITTSKRRKCWRHASADANLSSSTPLSKF